MRSSNPSVFVTVRGATTSPGVLDVPVDALEHGADLVPRLLDRLAHLARRELRALLGLGFEEIAERPEQRGPLRVRARGPGRLRGAGARDLLRDLAHFGDRDRSHDLAGRRVADLERVRLRERRRLGLRRLRPASAGAAAATGAAASRLRRFGRGAEVDGREELDPARLLLPGPAFEAADEALVGEAGERLLDVGERAERVPALGALLQLAGRLRAAEQEHAEQRRLRPVELERLLGDVAVLDHALAGGLHPARQLLLAQRVERVRRRPSRCTARSDRGSSTGCTR